MHCEQGVPLLGLVPSKFQTPCPLAAVGPIHPCDTLEEAEEAAFGGTWTPPVIQLITIATAASTATDSTAVVPPQVCPPPMVDFV